MLQQLPRETASVPAARAYVRGQLDAWPGDREIVELLTSELATNAVLHAHTPFTVSVRVGRGTVRVEIADADPSIPPAPAPPEPEALRGRGLLLVECLANRWGAFPEGSGKTMWFEVDATNGGPRTQPGTWPIDRGDGHDIP